MLSERCTAVSLYSPCDVSCLPRTDDKLFRALSLALLCFYVGRVGLIERRGCS